IKVLFRRRTIAMFVATLLGAAVLALIGLATTFWFVIIALILFGLLFAGITPIRQIYLNGLIPTEQRATLLSFDSLMGAGGAVVIQPILGKAADLWGYPLSYVASAGFQILSLPFFLLAKREKSESDTFE
ncbi:MAG TPA: MFS transporter, partial [Myxococcota bacterium]|nr:MFS transporter [Myxococcota bacterium]